ncbi:MAG: hypothetical protein R3A45_00790 [Bdellovibrionota bacterium]
MDIAVSLENKKSALIIGSDGGIGAAIIDILSKNNIKSIPIDINSADPLFRIDASSIECLTNFLKGNLPDIPDHIISNSWALP